MSMNVRALQSCLWLSVVAWGIGLVAKLFDLLVVAGSWGASPPESFVRLPYGAGYPVNPGAFFQPLSIVMALGILGALVAGWSQSRRMRFWLCLGTASFLAIWAITPTIFWPMINHQYGIATGKIVATSAEAVALATRWIAWDWFRVGLIATGFVASVRALCVSHDGEAHVSR